MSATRLSFAGGDAALVLDSTGELHAVEHRAAAGVNYLRWPVQVGGSVAGRPIAWRPLTYRLDSDEVEVELAAVGSALQVSLRHMLSAGWSTRIALRNTGEVEVEVDDLEVGFRAGAQCLGWGFAAGAEARYIVLPPEPDQPVLAGYLRVGAVAELGADGLHWGPVRVAPGSGYVLGWDWEWAPTPAAAAARRGGVVPWRQVLLADEVAFVDADPDAALVGPGGWTTRRGRHEIEAGLGSHRFEVHSARGLVEFDLEWVASPVDVLRLVAEHALTRRRTPAGVPELAGLEQALVVQHVLRAGGFGWSEEAEEALELVAARLAVELPATPLAALLLCGEYERTGDPELLDLAEQALAGIDRVVPGVGFATLRVGVALLGAGRTVPVPLAPTGRTCADLELAVVASDADHQLSLVRSLGRLLGAGLPGRAVVVPPVAELAHLVSVFSLLDDRIGGRRLPEWGVSPHELAQRALAELLARLSGAEAAPAYGWLALTVDSP